MGGYNCKADAKFAPEKDFHITCLYVLLSQPSESRIRNTKSKFCRVSHLISTDKGINSKEKSQILGA